MKKYRFWWIDKEKNNSLIYNPDFFRKVDLNIEQSVSSLRNHLTKYHSGDIMWLVIWRCGRWNT